jgi:hypothetical protein
MQIIDLAEVDSGRIDQVAALLTDGFSDTGSESWRSREEALLSVRESLQQGLTTGCSGRRWTKCQGTNGSAPPLNRDVRRLIRVDRASML